MRAAQQIGWMAVSALALLVACTTPEPAPPVDPGAPVPQAKPKIPPRPAPRKESTRRQWLAMLYQSQLHLTALHADQASLALEESLKLLPDSGLPAPTLSLLLAELTYLHHGTLSRLYIPIAREGDRFAELRQALSLLKAKRYEPVDFRLVSYRYKGPEAAEPLIRKALITVKDPSIADRSYAFLTAERELGKLYESAIAIEPYEGQPSYRFYLHYLAGRQFFSYGHYEIARIAATQAEMALHDRLAPPHDAEEAERTRIYEEKLARLKDAIEKQDPNLLGKLDEWWDRLVKK